MRNLLHRSTIILAVLLAATQVATAQAIVSAQRGSEIAPFAQATLISPDYGQSHNLGYTVGLDYTKFIRSSIVQPSIEFRYTSAKGITVNERSYAGGIKLQTTIHGIQPYATFLVGHGNIDLAVPQGTYAGDNAIVLAYGGGADFPVTQLFRVRAEIMGQHWNLEQATLTPTTYGLGLVYVVPFHGHGGQ
jgi:hypothetical protein